MHTQISLSTNFQLKLTTLIFWTKYAPKKVFFIKNRKGEYQRWILHIISISTKFQLTLTILIFWTNLPKKGISGQKQKKSTSSLNSAYSNWSGYQISACTNHFDFLGQICPKGCFLSKTEHLFHIKLFLQREQQTQQYL